MVFESIFKVLKRTFGIKRKKSRKKHGVLRKRARRVRRVRLRRRPRPRRAVRRKRHLLRRARRRRPAKKRGRMHVVRISSAKRKAAEKKKTRKPIELGVVTHYYPKVKAAVLKLKKPLALGEPIWIKGKTTDFRQTVGSMQIDRVPIPKARPGQEIGLEVLREVRPGDIVFLST
jgi:hypothetical protein